MDIKSQRKNTMRTIAGALHMSILLYLFVVFILADSQGWEMKWVIKPELTILLPIFIIMSLTTGGFSILAPKLLKNLAPKTELSAEVSSVLFFSFEDVTPNLQTLTIIRMAMAETIAIFGLALSFINQSPFFILPFAGAALLLQILVGPFGKFIRGN